MVELVIPFSFLLDQKGILSFFCQPRLRQREPKKDLFLVYPTVATHLACTPSTLLTLRQSSWCQQGVRVDTVTVVFIVHIVFEL